MSFSRRFLLLLALLCSAALSQAAPKAAAKAGAIAWQPWSDALFARAGREGKYILLDLEAVWCHWCHVMDATTYADATVAALIRRHYIAVKVDSDAHPELARRYEDYGWPATIVFDTKGVEIVKRRGYMRPEVMASMLEHIVRDPSPIAYADSAPVNEFAASPLLSRELHAALVRNHIDSHDFERGGFAQQQKFIDRDTLEYALHRAGQGDAASDALVRLDLDSACALIDPVWGGMYQYSTHGDWVHPHYEKIIQIQADALRLYARAWAQAREPRYLEAALAIHRYVKAFLTSPEGAFYVSQDADLVKGRHSEDYFALHDAGRRKQGMPAIDRNRYARENGWMIQSLVALHEVTGERGYLDEASAAARWIVRHRALDGGGFRHGERDRGGPFLEDTLAMGRAMLALYQASADRQWLRRAESAAGFIEQRFRATRQPGYVTSAARGVLAPKTVVDENIALVRFANLLARHTGAPRYRDMAEHAMRYLATDAVALRRRSEAGILLAALELASEPTHVTVVGTKGDAKAASLHRAALALPQVYRRIEWWDRSEGPMPNPDVQYPALPKAAAFVCTDGACSFPIFEPGELAQRTKQLQAVSSKQAR